MKLIRYIEQKGIKGFINSVLIRFFEPINKIFHDILTSILQINEKIMVFESEGDYSDNAFALYQFLDENNYLKSYTVVWLVDSVNSLKKYKRNNLKFIKKKPPYIDFLWCYYLSVCKYYIYTHNNLLYKLKDKEGRIVVNLWHGCGFKNGKGSDLNKDNRKFRQPDVVFMTGELFRPGHREVFKCDDKKIIPIGYSRNDYLFKEFNRIQQKYYDHFLGEYRFRILWMPTFRRSNRMALDEQYFNSVTGLPIIDNIEKLKNLNDYLKKRNTICFFKLHHLQLELKSFHEQYSNIVVLKDEDIIKEGLQLYQIVPMFDSLITDYSSIATDYMLLDRPILFTVDDYDVYNNSRGFIIDDPIKYFAGYCVRNQTDFYYAMEEILQGKDIFMNKRKELLPMYHKHIDGNTSKRIVEYLNL